MVNTVVDKYVYDMTNTTYNSRDEYDKKSKECKFYYLRTIRLLFQNFF